jgi:predicted lipoprotein with Yx(FWY)xxD motif
MRNSSKLARWAAPAGAAALAVMLAACGSNDNGTSASGGSGSGAAGSAVVSTSDISGVGTVLVDSSGKTLYFSDQESNGTIKCMDACLGFWDPVQATGSLPKDIQGLAVMTRSDNGEKQVTFDGSPLYTFSLDHGAGETNGNDLSDSFDGTSFTWHAATTDQSAGSSSSNNSGGSGDNDGSGYSNPYSY